MVLNWPHIHLMINHFPILGTVFGLALLAAAMLAGKEDVKKAALATFVITAVFAVLTFLTGEPTEEVVEHLPGVTERLIEPHEEFAEGALSGSIALGLLSIVLLYRSWGGAVGKWRSVLALLLAAAVAGAMAWTANLGGQIRHPETRPDFVKPSINDNVDMG